VFRNQSSIDPASLARYADQIGLDAARFRSDYEAPELRARAQSEAAAAESFGAKNTPAFMVNGKLKMGWGSWYAFRADVEKELAEARKLQEQGNAGRTDRRAKGPGPDRRRRDVSSLSGSGLENRAAGRIEEATKKRRRERSSEPDLRVRSCRIAGL